MPWNTPPQSVSGKTIRPHHLPSAIFRPHDAAGTPEAGMDRALQQWVAARVAAGATYKQIYSGMESTILKHLLHHFDHKPTILARVLKMNRATLLKKRRDLGLDT